MHTIGRKDKIDFPELAFNDVLAKIDSGAYSSSIHYSFLEEIEVGESKMLRVKFLDSNDFIEFKSFMKKKVKSSNGKVQIRYFVQLKVRIFDTDFNTRFSLSNRSKLKHPVLLGRKLLNNNFLIDTSKINCSFQLKKR